MRGASAKHILLAGFTEGCATMTLYAYGPLYVRQAMGEGSMAVASLAVGLYALTTFLLSGVWGRLGDWTRRPLFIMTGGLIGAAVGLVMMSVVKTAYAFLGFVVLESALMSAVPPLGMAVMTSAATEDRVTSQAASYYRTRALGWAVGSLGSGLLARSGITGIAWAFRLNGVIALLAAGVLGATIAYGYRQGANAKPKEGENPDQGVSTQMGRTVLRQPAVALFALVCLLGFAGYSAFTALLGPFLTEHLSGTASQVGLALGLMSAVEILAMGPAGRLADRISPGRVLFLGTLGYTLMFFAMFFVRTPFVMMVLLAFPFFPLMATGATGALARETSAAQRGEAMGVYEASAALGGFAGSLVGGLVSDTLGLVMVPVLCVALFVVAAAVTAGTNAKGSRPKVLGMGR